MERKIIFENEDIEIKTTGHDYDFVATIYNKTDKNMQFGIAEFGLDTNWEIPPRDWIGVEANEIVDDVIDCLEAGNFDYVLDYRR